MTEIKFLSHACIYIKTKNASILVDPWLIGSCYWRSWWNYPPVKLDDINNLQVDAIYITHVHWDHWHGPTLKKLFSKDTLIITHDEPNKRSIRDLQKIGFKNIKLLNHGESYKVSDITLTPYQFGLFLNDSALVIETSNMRLLNANDCKIAGASLKYILNNHGKFDFALRSHSSANDRVCYTLEDEIYNSDDADHYSRAFSLFMEAVKPKYAVPFASNHCHLHKDVYGLNHIINDPTKLESYINTHYRLVGTEFKIMLSGDSWSSVQGFNINQNNRVFFEFKDEYILKYKESVDDKLQAYYRLENKANLNLRIIKKFEEQINTIPLFLRSRFREFEYKLVLFNDIKEFYFIVNPYLGKVIECDNSINNGSEIRMPIKIFIDAVALNMFHHSSISKRNKYVFKTKELLLKYEQFQDLLELVELEVFPLRFKYILNLVLAYRLRWREVLVYFKAYFLKMKGMPIYNIEEEILKST